MATWCMIGKLNGNGSVTTINCHHDGYLEHAGTILADKYNDPKQLDTLLELGDLCCLGDTPEVSAAYSRDHNHALVMQVRAAYPDATFEATTYKDLQSVYDKFIEARSAFCYVMAQGSWMVVHMEHEQWTNWEDLTMVLEDLGVK